MLIKAVFAALRRIGKTETDAMPDCIGYVYMATQFTTVPHRHLLRAGRTGGHNMYRFERNIFINRPQQEVWNFVSNPANNTQWKRGAISADWTSESPPSVGSILRESAKFMGRTMEGTSEIIAWDPPNEDGQKKVGKDWSAEVTMKLEPKENGTQLTILSQHEMRGFMKIMERMVGRQGEKEWASVLDTLKVLLESGQA